MGRPFSQILKIRVGNVVLQIVVGQIRVEGTGNGLLVPDPGVGTHGAGNDGFGFFLAALGFALDLGDTGFVTGGSFAQTIEKAF